MDWKDAGCCPILVAGCVDLSTPLQERGQLQRDHLKAVGTDAINPEPLPLGGEPRHLEQRFGERCGDVVVWSRDGDAATEDVSQFPCLVLVEALHLCRHRAELSAIDSE